VNFLLKLLWVVVLEYAGDVYVGLGGQKGSSGLKFVKRVLFFRERLLIGRTKKSFRVEPGK
jgi:hypothetical protein